MVPKMDFLACDATSQPSMQVHTAMEICCKAEPQLTSTPANVTCISQHVLLNVTLFSMSEETVITSFHVLPLYLPHFWRHIHWEVAKVTSGRGESQIQDFPMVWCYYSSFVFLHRWATVMHLALPCSMQWAQASYPKCAIAVEQAVVHHWQIPIHTIKSTFSISWNSRGLVLMNVAGNQTRMPWAQAQVVIIYQLYCNLQ